MIKSLLVILFLSASIVAMTPSVRTAYQAFIRSPENRLTLGIPKNKLKERMKAVAENARSFFLTYEPALQLEEHADIRVALQARIYFVYHIVVCTDVVSMKLFGSTASAHINWLVVLHETIAELGPAHQLPHIFLMPGIELSLLPQLYIHITTFVRKLSEQIATRFTTFMNKKTALQEADEYYISLLLDCFWSFFIATYGRWLSAEAGEQLITALYRVQQRLESIHNEQAYADYLAAEFDLTTSDLWLVRMNVPIGMRKSFAWLVAALQG